LLVPPGSRSTFTNQEPIHRSAQKKPNSGSESSNRRNLTPLPRSGLVQPLIISGLVTVYPAKNVAQPWYISPPPANVPVGAEGCQSFRSGSICQGLSAFREPRRPPRHAFPSLRPTKSSTEPRYIALPPLWVAEPRGIDDSRVASQNRARAARPRSLFSFRDPAPHDRDRRGLGRRD